VEESAELADAMRRVVDAYGTGDESAWRELWSSRPGVLSLGSDPREWWDSHDVIVSLHARQSAERGAARFTIEKLAASQEGSVGWAVCSARVEWAGGSGTFRWTAVFHLERKQWLLAHLHRSFGVLNEAFGVELTANLAAIAADVGRERVDLSRATAPNGTVTILFTDIEGSTLMLEELGESAWMEMLHEHNRVVRAAANAEAGFEVKSQGDGFMLAFSSATGAARCAVAIQRAFAIGGDRLRVRIGLHTAEAIRETDDFYGRGVVLAARIAAAAGGGEILVSALVRELVASAGRFAFGDPIELELKGLQGVHRLFPLIALGDG